MVEIMLGYLSLFISAFGAATLLPLQSEAVLVGLISTGKYSVVLLIAVATIGNVLGSCVNWWLGTRIEQYKDKKWFPVSETKLSQAQKLYQQYGSPILLLSWIPVIGDPITLMSGVLKEKFSTFFIIVFIANLLRYLFLYIIFLGVFLA